MDNPKKSLQHLTDIEEKAEEILYSQQEIVALDKRRNAAREALRAMNKSQDKKVWMSLGPLLVKVDKSKAEAMLKKDQVIVDCEVNKIRSDLKVKVNKLRDMEYESPVPGLLLKPMERNEMGAMKQVLGYK
uniref:p53 and DNA damage-regulated protein 1 n=1 Tax=Cacopsylla melanoneura TaxID=428564 RepID=A0A8D8PXA9_9HEMI